MARPFSTKDVRRLCDTHRELSQKLLAAQDGPQQYQNDIRQAVDAYMAKEVLRTLKDIPVEEINRDRRGIRVKALRDYGYENLADLATASVASIASVRGISEDAAYSVRRAVQGLVKQVEEETRLRLSADERTPAATQLVTALSQYRKSLPYARTCKKLYTAHQQEIDYAIEDLAPAAGTLKWLFASKSSKEKAQKAYRLLQDLLSDGYGPDVREVLADLDAVDEITGSEAWEDFGENSISFFNALEDICPGVLGTGDAVYGLPEELARQVQEQDFFPDGLLCELRRYQEWGVKYILHQEKVLLGDEMGLGKTIQAIAVMVSLRNTGATHFVVVCPASVLTNWCREIRKQSKLQITKVHGAGRTAAFRSWEKTGGVAVTTYETVSSLEMPDDFRFSLLVVDEAHYIKNPKTRRTQNVKTFSSHAERLLFMTGTALENKVEEMIALIEMLRPDIAFQVRGLAFMPSAPQFREKVAPVYYRRKREDVLTELPQLVETKEWCTLTPQEEKVYEETIYRKNYQAIRRVSWNAPDLQNSSKARRLLELVEDAKSDGRKVIVFSFFLDTIRAVTALPGLSYVNPINGAVPPQRRQEIIDEFDKSPAGTVLPAQIQSGGTGLNIQSASVVIICEPQFKPSIENQAISRAYRMGQTRNVLVYRLLCEDTVDERITDLLEQKQKVFDAFADQSVAAQESLQLDDTKFGKIIEEEIERINKKHSQGGENTPPQEEAEEDFAVQE